MVVPLTRAVVVNGYPDVELLPHHATHFRHAVQTAMEKMVLEPNPGFSGCFIKNGPLMWWPSTTSQGHVLMKLSPAYNLGKALS